MSIDPDFAPHSNPFSTRRVRPGAIPFVFPPGDDAARLVDRLRQNGWWGEIVGPHGSGKSTLLAALVPLMETEGRRVVSYALHDGQRRLPIDLSKLPSAAEPMQLVVDGYEQLSHWSRWRLKQFVRRRNSGLLVTSHEPVGLPSLYRTETSLDLARTVVEHLVSQGDPRITREDVAEPFQAHAGDLRETLFALYDLYEARRHREP
jgi:energy-coupling factor transporter ATP-binding protein EcfA2